jgi:hypothetical protein
VGFIVIRNAEGTRSKRTTKLNKFSFILSLCQFMFVVLVVQAVISTMAAAVEDGTEAHSRN